MQPLKFESTQIFDLGRKKQEQTDLCVQFPELGLHCLIDGHGWTFQGAPAGQLLADALQKALTSESVTSQPSFATTCAAIRQALSVAHFRLRQEAEFLSQEAKSCSFLGLAFNPEIPGQALCFHAGTCRLYRLREIRLGEFRLDLLTGDHVDPTSREFESQLRNAVERPSAPPTLTRSIGKGDELALEETSVEVREADLLLLCSDGLSEMFPDHLIARVLARRRQKSMESLAQTLIAEANAAGGKDNISVILLGSEDMLPVLATEEAPLAASLEEPSVEEPIPQWASRPAPSSVQPSTEELASLVDRVAPAVTSARNDAPGPRRRVFLPLFILFAMVAFSAWMIWGGKSKSTEPTPQQAAASAASDPSPEPAIPSTPPDTQEVVPLPSVPPVPPTRKEESIALPAIAAIAREPAPSEAKIEAKPIEAKPIEAKPIEAKPIEAKPIEAKPIEAKPIEAKPIEAKPIEAKPIEAKPIATAATPTPVPALQPIPPPPQSTSSTPNAARVELAKVLPPAAPPQTIPTPSLPPPPPAPLPLPRATPPLPVDRNQSSDRANLPRERSRMEQLLLDYEILLVRSGMISPSDPQLRTPEARQVTPVAVEKASREEQRELLNEVRRLERDLEEVRALDSVRRHQLRTLRDRLAGRRN